MNLSHGLSSSMSPLSSNSLSQTLSNLQIILNNNSNSATVILPATNAATPTNHTSIQLDPHLLAHKTVKQLTNNQHAANKTTTILLTSPVQQQQQQHLAKESNEITLHGNDIDMKLESSSNTVAENTKENAASKVQGIRKLKI